MSIPLRPTRRLLACRPSFLDSYALVSGQLNTMVKSIKNERTPSFKRYICLPLTLSQDRDEDLARSTEGRIGQGGCSIPG